MLGPGWKSTTHILQARDLMRTRGAMAKFEEFLRPTGAGSTDTLAGRMSLDAYDRGIISASEGDMASAGEELEIEPGRIPVSRLLVIEDADHLGGIRQAYLRRMMKRSEWQVDSFLLLEHLRDLSMQSALEPK